MAAAPAGVPAFEALPPELLETIFGLLEARTLCTARLVCRHFRGAASKCIHSVVISAEDLRGRPETNLNSFPNLSRGALYDVGEDDLPVLAQSPVTAAVTELETTGYLELVPRRRQNNACSPLLSLGNLVSLWVSLDEEFQGRAPPFPQTLRDLNLQGCVPLRTANLVARLTNLTCLCMDLRILHKPFAAVSALTALQRLEICSDLAFAPFLATLTQLTHLEFLDPTFEGIVRSAYWKPVCPLRASLASLTRLHRLVHLGVGFIKQSLVHQFLVSLGTFSSLRSLALGFYHPEPSAPDTSWATHFSQLTALRVERGSLHPAMLPSLKGLQDLSLSSAVLLCQEGIAALNSATGLTSLRVCFHGLPNLGPEELGAPLSRMPGLRALSLSTSTLDERLCFEAMGLLSELTRLECVSGHVSDADVRVWLGLTKLRVLRLVPDTFGPPPTHPDTLELLFALAKLPELSKFRTNTAVWNYGLTAPARKLLDEDRHEKGWPPLELVVED